MDISDKNKKRAKEVLKDLDLIFKAFKASKNSSEFKLGEERADLLLEKFIGSYLENFDMKQTQTLALGTIANSHRRIAQAFEKAVDHYISTTSKKY